MQYFTYVAMFKEQAKSEENLITLEDFKGVIKTLINFGVSIEENEIESEFNNIDLNKEGKISFDDFCINIIQKSINNIEEDYRDDINDFKKLKNK